MNTREAMTITINAALNDKIAQKTFNQDYGKIVSKVLNSIEVLDILKKWILVEETNDDLFSYEIKVRYAMVSDNKCLKLEESEYKIIKEWLENEKD